MALSDINNRPFGGRDADASNGNCKGVNESGKDREGVESESKALHVEFVSVRLK
jgi:hypothetical protein